MAGLTTSTASALLPTGEINVNLLKKEIVLNLQEDKTYAAVDTMKKKAIHVAQSYDEFRNFVACAEQKCVTSKEMEELKEKKGSWTIRQTRGVKDRLKSKRLSQEEQYQVVFNEKSIIPEGKPGSSMEFVRDWNRILAYINVEEKRNGEVGEGEGKTFDGLDFIKTYLLEFVELGNIQELFGTEIAPDLLEGIVRNVAKCIILDNDGSDENKNSSLAFSKGDVKSFLGALPKCGRFKISLSFCVSESFIADINYLLKFADDKELEVFARGEFGLTKVVEKKEKPVRKKMVNDGMD